MVLLMLLGAGCAGRGPLQRFEFTRVCMGVQAHVVLYGANSQEASDSAAAAFERMAALDACMSDYRRDSELNRVSNASGGEPVPVSVELFEILETSQKIAAASQDAFDPTVGPCVLLWRASRRSGEFPEAGALGNAHSLVGWRGMELDRAARTVRLARPGMQLDLGGIAKGYAAQRGVDVLRERGVKTCLVSLAGDVAAGDAPPGQPGWRVAVTGCEASAPVGTLWLTNSAVSTSGGCEQFVEFGGVRYAHIVDPREGLGSRETHVVTVVAPRGELADALSTAAFLLGPDASRGMLRSWDAAAIFAPGDAGGAPVIVVGGGGVLRWESPPGHPGAAAK